MPRTIFVSHSIEDLQVATDVKALLRVFGFDGFVAHQDIELSQEWISRIVEALNSSVGLIYLLSDASKASDWTDQEAGFALCRNVPLIPISLGAGPWGFVSRYQAKRWHLSDSTSEYSRLKPNAAILGGALIDRGLLSVDELIATFGSSTSFTDAILRQLVLERRDDLSTGQVSQIIGLVAGNDELYRCVPVKNWMPRILPLLHGPEYYRARGLLRRVGVDTRRKRPYQ